VFSTRYSSWPLWLAILLGWGIALFEYCFAVPANRIGYGTFTGQQLKVMREVITLPVFAVFSVLFLGEQLRWTYFAAMGCMVAAVVVIFCRWINPPRRHAGTGNAAMGTGKGADSTCECD